RDRSARARRHDDRGPAERDERDEADDRDRAQDERDGRLDLAAGRSLTGHFFDFLLSSIRARGWRRSGPLTRLSRLVACATIELCPVLRSTPVAPSTAECRAQTGGLVGGSRIEGLPTRPRGGANAARTGRNAVEEVHRCTRSWSSSRTSPVRWRTSPRRWGRRASTSRTSPAPPAETAGGWRS